ncbi:MAG TPA: DUF4214 domain-containing protein, partial [Pirellulales bacterium]|nr:DUF4214 domain-containing protein [Pirellulales bacterium]
NDAGGSRATAIGTATVADAAVSAAAVTAAATEGAAFNGILATFIDAAGSEPIGDYKATIDWGDGTVRSNATVAFNSGVFTVSGTHTYAEEGTRSAVVTIAHDSAPTVSVVETVIVADAPLAGTSATIATGSTVSGIVASFRDPDAGDTVADYSASIDWGDGQTSPGSIGVGTGAGQFNVTGNHSYSDNSPHTISVAVTHGNDQPLIVKSVEPGQTVNVVGNFGLTEDIYVIGSGTVTVPAAKGVLANDTAPGPLTVTTGEVTGANGGTFVFHIDGSFTYAPPAAFPGFDYAQYAAKDARGDQGTATVNVLSQTGGIVWKFYESVLGRDPDYGGLKYWINDFASGGKTGDIAVGFFESTELLNRIITGYYEQYLLREPDSHGLAYWEGVWHAQGGPEQIKAGFADSPEFYNSAGGTPEAWVVALYHRILNRVPDPQGEQYWINTYQQQVAAGVDPGTVRYNIALGFFTSHEDFGNDVAGWFREYLFRNPTSSESAQYVGEMEAGKTDRQIEQEITNLPQYGAEPPPAPPGEGVALPDYQKLAIQANQQAPALVAAKDAVFYGLGARTE